MAPVVDLPPLAVILSWPKPNYVDPIRRGPGIFVITSIMLALATFSVFARLYTRIFVRRWFGLDDAFIVMSYLCAIGVTAAVFVGTMYYSWDRHVWDVPIDQILPGGKILFTSAICWALSTCFTKLSLVCFYYRLADHIQLRKFRWILHGIIVVQVSFMTAYLMTLIFMCVPVNAFWTYPPNLNATCIHTGVFLFTISCINTVLELIVWLVPLPMLMAIHLDARQRIPVMVLLMAGLLVPVVGAVRCYYVYVDIVISWDVYWYAEPQWICSDVENYLALICACAPALRPLFGRLFGWKDVEHHDRAQLVSPSRSDGPITPDSTAQMKYVTQQSLMWFDLEGIADDGLGYSVSVTTGQNGTVTGVVHNKKTGFGGIKARTSMNRLVGNKSRDDQDRQPDDAVIRRSGSRLKSRILGEVQEIGAPRSILTKRTVEIRESFDSEAQDGGEEIRVWQSPSVKDFGASSGTSESEDGFEERLDGLGVLPPLLDRGDSSGRRRLQSDLHQRPQTAPVASNHHGADDGSLVPQIPQLAFNRKSLPRWLSPPQTPLSRRRYRGDIVLAPTNSSQWWAGSGGGVATDANSTTRNSLQGTTRPHTAVVAESVRPATMQTAESIRSMSAPSDDGSFMREIADLRGLMFQRASNGTEPGADDESVFVEDGSRASGQGSKKTKTSTERKAMIHSQKKVKEWNERATQT